jgi:hypothetical protein
MNVRSILIILVVLIGVLYTYYKKPKYQRSSATSIQYENNGKVNIPLLLEFLNGRPKNNRIIVKDDVYYKAIMACRKYQIKESIPWLIENVDLHTEDYYNAYGNQEYIAMYHYFPCLETLRYLDCDIELLIEKAADINNYGSDICLVFLKHFQTYKTNDKQKKRIDEISSQRKKEFVADLSFPDVKKTLDGPMYMGGTNMEIEQLRKRAEDRRREAELKNN